MSRLVRVLIVADDPVFRNGFRSVLRAAKMAAAKNLHSVAGARMSDFAFAMAEADDLDAAVEAVSAFRPDIILCDFDSMPMRGADFLRALRGLAEPDLRMTPVLMTAEDVDSDFLHDWARIGVNGFLGKPLSPAELSSRLVVALDGLSPARA